MSCSPAIDCVKRVLARAWDVPPEAIPDNAALNRHEKWDSLGHISIMMALSEEFEFELNAEIVQRLLSLPKIVAFVQQSTDAATGVVPDEHSSVHSA